MIKDLLDRGKWLDYDKTVNRKRLVFMGSTFEKIGDYFSLIVIIGLGTISCYMVFNTQIHNNPTQLDYIMAVVIPLLIIFLVFNICRAFLNRDKIKEIKTNVDINSAKIKFIEAGRNLQWNARVVKDNYIVFTTKPNRSMQLQIVTLIIFPDNKIYFNSHKSIQGSYFLPSFNDNYQELVKEYLRIEKE